MLGRDDVKGTPLEPGIQAIYDTSRHLSEFVKNYRKMSELEKPVLADVALRPLLDDVCKAYPELTWEVNITSGVTVRADVGMLRQVLMNLAKNAVEAEAKKIVITPIHERQPAGESMSGIMPSTNQLRLYIGNDGLPIPAENRQSLFVPFFTTKRNGSGIGLSLSRRMMIQQGGMLDLAEKPLSGCHVGFILTVMVP